MDKLLREIAQQVRRKKKLPQPEGRGNLTKLNLLIKITQIIARLINIVKHSIPEYKF